MNTCSVHETGTLLLDMSHMALLEKTLADCISMQGKIISYPLPHNSRFYFTKILKNTCTNMKYILEFSGTQNVTKEIKI